MYVLSAAIVCAAIFYGVRKALETRRTDFAFLSASLVISQIVLAIVFWVFSIELGPTFYIGLTIPLCFTALFALNSKTILSIGVGSMFFVSLFSLVASTKTLDATNEKRVSKISQELKSRSITNAIATHTLSYPIIVESDNDITVTPFDYNAFDQKRASKVQKSVEAIIVEQDDKDQTDVALCIQGTFGQAFERIGIEKTDIYIVPKELRSKTWEVAKLCVERP